MNKTLVQFYLTGLEKGYFKSGYGITSTAYTTDWYLEMSGLEDQVYPDEFNRTKTEEWERATRVRRAQVMRSLKK